MTSIGDMDLRAIVYYSFSNFPTFGTWVSTVRGWISRGEDEDPAVITFYFGYI